jgi:hypothetical protein
MDDRANEEMTAAERILREANEEMTAAERLQSSTFKSTNEGMEAMLRVQNELLDMYDRASRDWLARSSAKAELWTGLACGARHETLRPGRYKILSGVHVATRGDGRAGCTMAVERVWNHYAKDQSDQ